MSDNPLKQYFRRPAVYLKLPSGGLGYPEGTIDMPDTGELPVYPMTAIDEITSRTPDALFNGTAVVEVIKSCIPNIKDPWQLSNVDIDPILVAIRAATHGSNMEIETDCPECKETGKYDLNLSGVLADFKPGNYNEPLIIGEISFKFKPLKFSEMNEATLAQFQVQKALQILSKIEDDASRDTKSSELILQINQMTMKLVASTIEYMRVPTATVFENEFIFEFLTQCDKKTYDAVQEHSIALRRSTENKPLKITCVHCGHEYEQPFSVNVTDFFE